MVLLTSISAKTFFCAFVGLKILYHICILLELCRMIEQNGRQQLHQDAVCYSVRHLLYSSSHLIVAVLSYPRDTSRLFLQGFYISLRIHLGLSNLRWRVSFVYTCCNLLPLILILILLVMQHLRVCVFRRTHTGVCGGNSWYEIRFFVFMFDFVVAFQQRMLCQSETTALNCSSIILGIEKQPTLILSISFLRLTQM